MLGEKPHEKKGEKKRKTSKLPAVAFRRWIASSVDEGVNG
jgi:hypothetical protein